MSKEFIFFDNLFYQYYVIKKFVFDKKRFTDFNIICLDVKDITIITKKTTPRVDVTFGHVGFRFHLTGSVFTSSASIHSIFL